MRNLGFEVALGAWLVYPLNFDGVVSRLLQVVGELERLDDLGSESALEGQGALEVWYLALEDELVLEDAESAILKCEITLVFAGDQRPVMDLEASLRFGGDGQLGGRDLNVLVLAGELC